MDGKRGRRRYLQLFGAAFVVGAAGCTDSGDNETGGSDNPDSDDDTTDDEGADTDDTSGNETDDDTGDTDEGESNGDEQPDGDEEDTAPRLAEVFTWTDSYVMEIESDEFEGTWRFNDGDWQLTTTTDDQTSETYSISTDSGRETYVVRQNQCVKTESSDQFGDRFDPEEPADDSQEYVASGRTTIDGQEVYEFDVDNGTYYVSVDTGYPVRFEGTEGTTARFHSWGDTEPITAPEMECIER